jgi:hypothetical protein
MGIVDINQIVSENRRATRLELNDLFRQHVCEVMCPRVIKLMDEWEVKRLLALHLFDMNIVRHAKNRPLLLKHMGIALGVSKSTLYEWFPASSTVDTDG